VLEQQAAQASLSWDVVVKTGSNLTPFTLDGPRNSRGTIRVKFSYCNVRLGSEADDHFGSNRPGAAVRREMALTRRLSNNKRK
jgi:hypothetical protein